MAPAGERLPRPEPLTWRHPEWWSIALSAAAWLALLARSGAAAAGAGSSPAHHAHAATAASVGGPASAWAAETLDWSLMVVAMMLPLVLPSVRVTAARSLWPRRHRAIGGFLVGYLSPWLLVGLATSLLVVALGLDRWLGLPLAGAVGFALAAAWQVTPAKGRALRSCDRTAPLAPRGWRADRDCVRYGWMIGGRCLVSCWALMLACVLGGHGLAAMAGASVVGAAERYTTRPDERLTSGLLVGLALTYATVAFLSI